jgi:ribonuclease HII
MGPQRAHSVAASVSAAFRREASRSRIASCRLGVKPRVMANNLWSYENKARDKGYRRIAGVDEAGRGPLAGPVVAAAVILAPEPVLTDLADSKQLTARRREALYAQIYAQALSIGIGIIDPPEIDRINILNAALLAMLIAVVNLKPAAECVLVDGPWCIAANLPQEAICKGDCLSASIAAASIVAKVSRDRLMQRYHEEYPRFGFSRHKGYPTRAHKAAIRRFGCSPIHRRSFKGVREYV